MAQQNETTIEAYLYDANGVDVKVEIDDVNVTKLNEDQLLWVNVLDRQDATLKRVALALAVEGVPVRAVTDIARRPRIEQFEDFFRFSVDSVQVEKGQSPKMIQIDFIVGKNLIVTVHEGQVPYFAEFRKREKGETQLGELDAESFLATLLDLHIVSYFQAMEEIERRVDEFDERVLKKDMTTEEFLADVVRLRHDVGKLRRWLLPHRDVFYSLARVDFRQVAESDHSEEYRHLNEHFENAVDAVENARETVLSIFELFATKSAQETNHLIRKLTFLTLIVGSLGVIAGIFGMNYQLSYFEAEDGFWFTIAGMGIIASTWTAIAKWKGWL